MTAVLTIGDVPVEVLGEGECLRLLGTARLGRIGYTEGALPAIRPVSFTVRDGAVVIPAQRGSSVVRALSGAIVAFSVDSYGAEDGAGWSVTVVAPTRVVSEPADLAELDLLLLADPGAGPLCYLVLERGLVRGWRTGARAG